MAFGDNYKPVYEIPMLADGEYLARIESVTLDTYPSGDEYASVKVSIKDHPNSNPSIFFLNSIPQVGQFKANGAQITQSDVDRACRQQTTFFECFGIAIGDFDITHWKGKTGLVKIMPSYDKNEPDKKSKTYKTIYPQKPKATAQQSSTATQTSVMQPSASQPTATAQTQPQQATAQPADLTQFPEDIPF